jgi:hypothetical protein
VIRAIHGEFELNRGVGKPVNLSHRKNRSVGQVLATRGVSRDPDSDLLRGNVLGSQALESNLHCSYNSFAGT